MWRKLVMLASLVAGMWAADLLVPAFRIGGSQQARLLAGAGIAGVATLVAVALIVPLVLIIGSMLLADVSRGVSVEYANDDGSFPAPTVSRTSIVLAGLLFMGAVVAVVVPVAFVAGARLVDRLGASVELAGGWALWTAAGLVFWGVYDGVRGALAPRRPSDGPAEWAGHLLSLGAVTGALWLATVFAPGVRLAPGSRPAWVDLLALAAVVVAMRVLIPGRLGLILQVAVDVAVLATLDRAGALLARPLEFDGWGSLAAAAVICTVVTAPVRLFASGPAMPVPMTVTTTGWHVDGQ